jgi:hypothetical protein
MSQDLSSLRLRHSHIFSNDREAFFSPQKRASHVVGRGNPSHPMEQARMMIKLLNVFDILAPVPEFSTFQDVTCLSLKHSENCSKEILLLSLSSPRYLSSPSKPEAKDISA